MLKIHTVNNRVYWTWQLEIITMKGVVKFSKTAHSLLELSELLKEASEIVLQEHIEELKQS